MPAPAPGLPFFGNSFGGDGGLATAARLFAPQEVLPTRGGSLLVSDTGNARVRKVTSNGTITTFAGDGDIMGVGGRGDGGPAIRASITRPTGLARVPGGDIVIGDGPRVRRVTRNGTISTLVNLAALTRDGARLGDFAGRTGGNVLGLNLAAEAGLAIAADRLYYRAPADTERTLVTFRDAHVSGHSVAVEFDATKAGRARLEVRRRGRLIASTVRAIQAGRRKLSVTARFSPQTHTVRLKLTSRNAMARDEVALFISRVLPSLDSNAELAARVGEVVVSAGAQDEGYIDRCRRQTRKRIDCAVAYAGEYCVSVIAIVLRPSGGLFWRTYGCRSLKRPFDRAPVWRGPAEVLPNAPR